MKKAIWQLLSTLGFALVALAQKQPKVMHQNGGISEKGEMMLTAIMAFAIGMILSSLISLHRSRARRRERRYWRELLDAEIEEKIDGLKSSISMLQLENKGLRDKSEIVTTKLALVETAVADSVVFDRYAIVAFEDERYTFAFVGCERQDDGRFAGLYLCPVCKKGRLSVPESDTSAEIFRGHLGECPGLNRVLAAGK